MLTASDRIVMADVCIVCGTYAWEGEIVCPMCKRGSGPLVPAIREGERKCEDVSANTVIVKPKKMKRLRILF